MATGRGSTRSESPVAARAELDQASADNAQESREDQLEEQASDQESQQADELRLGKRMGRQADLTGESIVTQREGGPRREGPVRGFVDAMSKRDDSDALEGHFVTIDADNADAKRAVEAVVGEDNFGQGRADYGVFFNVLTRGDDGYPDMVQVQLRDEHAAFVTVPYESLSPAGQGGRR